MEIRRGRLGEGVPERLPEELVETVARGPGVRVERIVSRGHRSPDGFWYDQPEDEWVALVAGSATLLLADGRRVELRPGDWVDLPAGTRHRVERTDPDADTIWIAVFRPAAGDPPPA
jgi:cupin 2 domain-containing protein